MWRTQALVTELAIVSYMWGGAVTNQLQLIISPLHFQSHLKEF